MFQFQYFHIPRILSRDYCTRALQALSKVIKKPQQGIINLIVINPEEMATMNEKFRGKEGPTDILTFSFLEREKSQKVKKPKSKDFLKNGNNGGVPSTKYQVPNTSDVAGEIYLCLEKIKIYAKEREHTYREELEYIVIHGLVHLMGYDHETEEDLQEMEEVEAIIQSYLDQDK